MKTKRLPPLNSLQAFEAAGRYESFLEAATEQTVTSGSISRHVRLLESYLETELFCRRIGWFKPDGGLKDMMARVTMLAMHRDGLIALPAPQGRQNRPGPIVFGPDTEPPLFPAPTTLDKVRPLDLRPVVRGTRRASSGTSSSPATTIEAATMFQGVS